MSCLIDAASDSQLCSYVMYTCDSVFSGTWEPAGAENLAVRASGVDRGRGGSSAVLPAAFGGGLRGMQGHAGLQADQHWSG